jgi:hypothetical protein
MLWHRATLSLPQCIINRERNRGRMGDDTGLFYSVEQTIDLVNQIQRGSLYTIGLWLVVALAISLFALGWRAVVGVGIFGLASCVAVFSVCARARIEIQKKSIDAR